MYGIGGDNNIGIGFQPLFSSNSGVNSEKIYDAIALGTNANYYANDGQSDIISIGNHSNYTGVDAENKKQIVSLGYYADPPFANISYQANFADMIYGYGVNKGSLQSDSYIGINTLPDTTQAQRTKIGGGLLVDTFQVGDSVVTESNVAAWDAAADSMDQDLRKSASPTFGGLDMDGNVNLNGHYLSGDGDDEGVYVDTNGYVGVRLIYH